MQHIASQSAHSSFVPAFPTWTPLALNRPCRAEADRAVVVFVEDTHLPKLRRLKPGFRHCHAYLRSPQGWIGVDSLAHRLEIRCFPDWPWGADLAAHLRRLGQCAITVAVAEPPRRLAPPLPFSCVEAVKRLIGLHCWRIRTPWELFLHLRKISLDNDPYMFQLYHP